VKETNMNGRKSIPKICLDHEGTAGHAPSRVVGTKNRLASVPGKTDGLESPLSIQSDAQI
jgi:hypothetical protein